MKCPFCGNITNEKICPQCKAEIPTKKPKNEKGAKHDGT